MAESNFVDYVKIYCRSGKGAMEGEEVMCISVVTGITGRSFT